VLWQPTQAPTCGNVVNHISDDLRARGWAPRDFSPRQEKVLPVTSWSAGIPENTVAFALARGMLLRRAWRNHVNDQRLLTPIDFSPTSDIAFNYAIDVAMQQGGSIHLLHVIDDASFAIADPDTSRIADVIAAEAVARRQATLLATRKGN
jgi:hypothetical protein